jgi:hypothetical protein
VLAPDRIRTRAWAAAAARLHDRWLLPLPAAYCTQDHAHSIGLKMGWYANNCGCNEHQNVPSWGPAQTTGKLAFGARRSNAVFGAFFIHLQTDHICQHRLGTNSRKYSETTVWLAGKGPLTDGLYHYESEVQATIDFGFDGAKAKQSTSIDAFHKTCHMETGWICFSCRHAGIKLDGCGEFLNLTVFANLMNKTGKPILIENCHWGHDGPGDWVRRGRRAPTTWPTIVLNLKHTQLNSNVFVC